MSASGTNSLQRATLISVLGSAFMWRMAFLAALVLGAAFVLIERAAIGQSLPVWMDESFTLTAASSPTWSVLKQQVWMDSNAPLHSILTWLWPFKNVDSLRELSETFMLCAAALPLLWGATLTIYQRACWAALLLFWQPGVIFSVDARPYALLMFVATAQTIAFVRLLTAPDRNRAFIWSGLGALAVLTHYFAAFLFLAQCIAYLAVHRGRAMQTWPALLAFLPVAAEIAWHLPRLAAWATPGISWQQAFSIKGAAYALLLPFGPTPFLGLVTLIILLACNGASPENPHRPAFVAFAASAACLGALVVAGMLKPVIVTRYITPEVPGVLLGVMLLARRPPGYAAVAGWFLLAHNPVGTYADLRGQAHFGLDEPSRALLAARPDVMAYAMDCPCSKAFDPETMKRIGERVFREAGLGTQVRWVSVDSDAARELLNATAGANRPAIIWASNKAAAPDFEGLAPDWRCARFGKATLACAPRWLPIGPGQPG